MRVKDSLGIASCLFEAPGLFVRRACSWLLLLALIGAFAPLLQANEGVPIATPDVSIDVGQLQTWKLGKY